MMVFSGGGLKEISTHLFLFVVIQQPLFFSLQPQAKNPTISILHESIKVFQESPAPKPQTEAIVGKRYQRATADLL
jgi:hypothetical protein